VKLIYRWLPESGLLLATQALVQFVALGSTVLALGLLSPHEVGLLAIQAAISAWLFFTHAGVLNHIYNELPRLNQHDQKDARRLMLRSGIGAILSFALPITIVGSVPFLIIFQSDLGNGQRVVEFFFAVVLTVLGTQWTQAKECDVKAMGDAPALARWNILQAFTGVAPLVLLTFLPPYPVFLFRAVLGHTALAIYLFSRGDLIFFSPRFAKIPEYIKGGLHLVVCQLLGVLILQGERLLMGHKYGIVTVGELQLYFLLQTGAQLIPVTTINVWFPHARRDPTTVVLKRSIAKALQFNFVTFSLLFIGSIICWLLLQREWVDVKFQVASRGLFLAAWIAPAYTFSSLLFVFMARNRVLHFVLLQTVVLLLQVVLYELGGNHWHHDTVMFARAGVLYAATFVCIMMALRLSRSEIDVHASPSDLPDD
jgi:O-antigen/teichoic acid export membrane protein